ncbi:MAG: DUF5615 family PIN-like protein [Chthoniobacterales bacterium]
MKLKFDENLPEALVSRLAALGHDVDNVREEGFARRDDSAVWAAAQESERFLITQDLDFSDRRRFAPRSHRGLLLVRLPWAGRLALTARIEELFRVEAVESWQQCFVVLSAHKLRVSRPKT